MLFLFQMSLCTKLDTSYLAMVLRQLVLILTHSGDQLSSSYRVKLAHNLMPIASELRKLAPCLPNCFYTVSSARLTVTVIWW